MAASELPAIVPSMDNSVAVAPDASVNELPVIAPVAVRAPSTLSASFMLMMVESSELIDVPLNFNEPRLILPVPFGVIVMLPLVTPVVISKLLTFRLASRVFISLSEPYNSTKLSLILSNAVRYGSPVPSVALVPMLIVCLAIDIIYCNFYKPNVI